MHYKAATVNEKGEINNWVHVGQDEKTLSEYNLSPEKVIRAAERTQKIAKGYQVRDLRSVTNLIEDSVANWDGDVKTVMDPLRFFNVPVCDLDSVRDISLGFECNPADKGGWVKECAISIMSAACSGLKMGDTRWPYDGSDFIFPVFGGGV